MSLPTQDATRWQARAAEARDERDPDLGVLADTVDTLMRAVPVGKTGDERRDIVLGALLQVRNYAVRKERSSAQAAANAAIEGFQTTVRLAVEQVCKRKVSADFSIVADDRP